MHQRYMNEMLPHVSFHHIQTYFHSFLIYVVFREWPKERAEGNPLHPGPPRRTRYMCLGSFLIEYQSVTSSNFHFCISAFSWPYVMWSSKISQNLEILILRSENVFCFLLFLAPFHYWWPISMGFSAKCSCQNDAYI